MSRCFIIQVNLKNMGVSYKGYALLDYLLDRVFVDFKSADIQKERCLFFNSSTEVKDAMEELRKAELIKSYNWDRGSVSDIKPNRELIVNISSIPETKQIIIKKPKYEMKTKSEISDSVLTIVKHYNEIDVFKSTSLTKSIENYANIALEKYTVEQIIEAIDFASNQQWVIGKVDEIWFNLSWILKNIDGFMAGGKYNKYGKIQQDNTSKYLKNNDDTTFFL